jgi:two-component system, OmpR family, phosphate regulon sensor histidine kinase PhoR
MQTMSWRSLILSARWLVFALVAIILVVWLQLYVQFRQVSHIVSENMLNEIQAEISLVAALVEQRAQQAADQPNNYAHLGSLVLSKERRLTIISPDGIALYDSQGDTALMDNHNNRPEVVAARQHGIGVGRRYSDTLSTHLLYAAKLLPDNHVVRIATPLIIEQHLEQKLLPPMTFTLLAIIMVALAILFYHVWHDRYRVMELISVADAFAHGQFTRRADLIGQDSMAYLGYALNRMGSQLQDNAEKITQQQMLLDGALGALSEGVACLDLQDRIIYANPAFRHLAAASTSVLGQPYYLFIPVYNSHNNTFEHHRRQLRSTLVAAGDTARVLIVHDESEMRQTESARRDFMNAVSHELKTPLTSIVGFTESLLDGVIEQDPQTTRDFTERIHKQCNRLIELVHDILSLSRLEHGALSVHCRQMDAVEIAQTVIDEQRAIAEKNNIRLDVIGEPSVAMVSDPELIRQLLGNLVSNAIRYNRPGGTVTIHCTQEHHTHARLVVADTGIGIPPEHLDRIFERFYRVDHHRSRQSGGTGLGLAIIKQILHVLAGTITVESDANGSRFTVSLPLRDPRSQRTTSNGAHPEHSPRIS